MIFECNRSSLLFCLLWIFPWIKFYWYSFLALLLDTLALLILKIPLILWCKLGRLNCFLQFFREGPSSLNSKEFCYSHAISCSLCKGGTSIYPGLFSKIFSEFLFIFSTGFTWISDLLPFPLYMLLMLPTF